MLPPGTLREYDKCYHDHCRHTVEVVLETLLKMTIKRWHCSGNECYGDVFLSHSTRYSAEPNVSTQYTAVDSMTRSNCLRLRS
jgi:hypothetical protein